MVKVLPSPLSMTMALASRPVGGVRCLLGDLLRNGRLDLAVRHLGFGRIAWVADQLVHRRLDVGDVRCPTIRTGFGHEGIARRVIFNRGGMRLMLVVNEFAGQKIGHLRVIRVDRQRDRGRAEGIDLSESFGGFRVEQIRNGGLLVQRHTEVAEFGVQSLAAVVLDGHC
jgi:hypothetical protein